MQTFSPESLKGKVPDRLILTLEESSRAYDQAKRQMEELVKDPEIPVTKIQLAAQAANNIWLELKKLNNEIDEYITTKQWEKIAYG